MTPPRNLEVEQALLGQMMFDPSVVECIPEGLRGAHFHEPYHQRVYDTCRAAIVAGRAADPTLISDTLKSDPGYDEFGGLSYLSDLMNRAPPTKSAPSYAGAIIDLALRRSLIEFGQTVSSRAGNTTITAVERLREAEAELFNLAEAGEAERPIAPLSKALAGAMQMAEAAYKRDGKLSGLTTHLIDLDRKLGGLHPSDLVVLAGRPSMGKTALATNMAFRTAKAGGKVLFFSLEMSEEQLGMRILADAAGVDSDRIRKGEITRDEFERLRDAQREIAGAPLHIDGTGGLNIARLCARARRHKRKHGLDLLVVDYLQLLTTDNISRGNRVQEVSEITGALKALAKELGVPILALSQLSRKVEDREDKRPQLADLRESGSIEQDADVVMFVYREAYYVERLEPKIGSPEWLTWREGLDEIQHVAEVVIGKQRHGPIGNVKVAFDAATVSFGNLARGDSYRAVGVAEPCFSYGGAG